MVRRRKEKMDKTFFKLNGVRGESKAPRHVDEMEIYSYTWAVHNSPQGGIGRERASANDLTIYKRTDSTSSLLHLAAADGRVFTNGKLTLEKVSPSGGLLRSVVVKLESVVVTSFSMNNDGDTIGINFQVARFEDPKDSGKPDGPSRNDWNLGGGRGA
jgi:type VI protein secretion system component Hcp